MTSGLQGLEDAAQLVHQTSLLGIPAGPDPASCNLVDALFGQLSRFRHLGDEVVVEAVDPLLSSLFLRWSPGIPEVQEIGQLSPLECPVVDPELLRQGREPR